MDSIAFLAAGDIAVTTLCLAVAAYEIWLGLQRPEGKRHLPAATVALATAVYAMAMGVQYSTVAAGVARAMVVVEFLSIEVLVHALLSFSVPMTGRPLPWSRRWEAAFGLAWALAIVGTDRVVPGSVAPIDVILLAHPYLQPPATPLTVLFLVTYLGMAAFASIRVARGVPDRWDARAFGVSLGVWTVCGGLDIAGTVGLWAPSAPFLMEYGFAAMALALLGTDVRRYGMLLRQAETSRAEILESFQLIIESAPVAVLVHGGGRVLYTNPECRRILGYDSADELVDTPVLDLVHPEERELVAQRIRGVVETGVPSPRRESKMLRADGSAVYMDFFGVPVVFAGVPAVLAMAQDVTEQRALIARTMEVDRVIAVGTLAAGVAHEINNPLAYVLANIEFVLAELPSMGAGGATTEVIEALSDARAGADRVRDIVHDLRAFSREDEHVTAPVDLVSVIGRTLNIASNEARHRARLITALKPVPVVLGNEGKLGQVVLNLVVNAAQAIPEGRAEANEIRVATSTDERGFAVVEVSDTGTGIPREARSRIFDPFFTTKPPGEGTGLGLSISSRIVLAHGGEMTFDSAVDRGTTFRVCFPPAPPQPARDAPASVPPSVEGALRRRVLVVDDELLVARALARSLRSAFDVEIAQSGAEALERLGTEPAIDGIVCDLMMPSMTGMQLHAAVERRVPTLAARIVFMTGGAFTPEARSFLERVPNKCLGKPYDVRALRAALRALWNAPPSE